MAKTYSKKGRTHRKKSQKGGYVVPDIDSATTSKQRSRSRSRSRSKTSRTRSNKDTKPQ